jgi:tetratricopeptide (TPR) repeat protein
MIAQSFSHQPDWLKIAVECPNPFLAEKLFERAAAECHKNGGEKERDCLKNFAQFCEEQGKTDKAEHLLRQALVLAGDDTYAADDVTESLGRLLERQGRGSEALALYLQCYRNSVVQRELDFAGRLAIKYYVRHHMLDGEEDFRLQMLQACQAPSWSRLREGETTELAELAIERKRPAQARRWLSQLKAEPACLNTTAGQGPDLYPDWYKLTLWAWCHEQAGQLKEADADYRKAIQLNQTALDPESEYQARLQYVSFLKRHGRGSETRPHEEFCARVQKQYHFQLPSTASEPKLIGRENWQRESQCPFESPATARNADLLNGAQYLYGQVVDQEFGFRRALEQAKGSTERAWRLEDLCRCLARKKKTKEALDTLNKLFDLDEQGAQDPLVGTAEGLRTAKRAVMNLLLDEKEVGEALKLTHRQAAYYDKTLGSDNCLKGPDMGADAEDYLAHKFYAQSIQVSNEALAFYEDRKAKKRECSSKFVMEIVLKCLAVSNARLGRLQEAQGYYERLVPESKKLDNGGNVLEDLQEYAKVCQDLGDTRKAAQLVKQAEEWESKCKRAGVPLNKSDDPAYTGKP